MPNLPEWSEQNPLTLRELLTQIVVAEIAGFSDRQRQCRLLQVLSPAHIHLGVEQGKVESGGRDLDQGIDPEQAVETAL